MPKSWIEGEISEFCDLLREKGRSLLYINRVLNNLKTFFKLNGYEGKLKISGYHVPPRYRSRPEYTPTPDEALKMADVAGCLRDRAIILILSSSGLRNSTLRALMYGDVREELERGEEIICLHVRPEMKKLYRMLVRDGSLITLS